MNEITVAAVDLGATSGRVMLGRVRADRVELETVHRFENSPVELPDGLRWNILELYRNILVGLTSIARSGVQIQSIGIDSWAVDYGLQRGGHLLGTPFHYRDARNDAAVERVHARVPLDEIAARNGLQFLSFNTLYQLEADEQAGLLDLADRALLIPDLLASWLTGVERTEITNASTTGLLSPATHDWHPGLFAAAGADPALFAPLISPGEHYGPLLPAVAAATGLPIGTPVVAVGSHDTASAVAAVPMDPDSAAYVSCGTWGLVGIELPAPILSAPARAANFTNEGGVDGTVRFLRNVMGLWLLSESVRWWERDGSPIELTELLAEAAAVTTPVALFDADDARFQAPGDMPERIAEAIREAGGEAPQGRAEIVRSIIDSLAEAFARAVRTADELSGHRSERIHVVGGGSQNALLCQSLADRSGLPVLAGPVEATALGNVLLQARAHGSGDDDLTALRARVAASVQPRRFEPRA